MVVFRSYILWIQRAVRRQIEFLSHAGVGGVGEGVFAVGGVLQLAAAQGQAHHHVRQFRPQVRGVALAAHLGHLGFLVSVRRGLEVGGVLRGDFRQGVGLELVENVVGGGFQRGAADVYVGADAVFGQDAFVGGVFDFGLALDIMDFGEQRFFGGGLRRRSPVWRR